MLLLVGEICCIKKFNKFNYRHVLDLTLLSKKDFENVEIIISRGANYIYDTNFLSNFKRLKKIYLLQIGNDNVDLSFCKTKGIEVRNFVSSKSIDAVAQMTISSLILGLRQAFFLGNRLKNGIYTRQPLGYQMEGLKVGIMGFGRIGKKVYEFLKNFSLKISAYDVFEQAFVGYKNENINFFTDLDYFLNEVEYLLVHIPGDKQNEGILNYNKLKNIKGLINFARASVVNEKDILRLLNEGSLQFYITDVIKGEPNIDNINKDLLNHEKVFVFPHIGANTYQVQKDLVEQVLKVL